MYLISAIQDALNNQHTNELRANLAYIHLANSMDALGFDGFAAWFDRAAAEELTHAAKVRAYVRARGQAQVYAVQPISVEIKRPIEAFQAALGLERENTDQWQALAALARKVGDDATYGLILWFLAEQVESENTIAKIVQQLTGADHGTLVLYDRQLGD